MFTIGGSKWHLLLVLEVTLIQGAPALMDVINSKTELAVFSVTAVRGEVQNDPLIQTSSNLGMQ